MRYAFEYSGLARSFPVRGDVSQSRLRSLLSTTATKAKTSLTFAQFKNSSGLCHLVLIGVTEGFIIGA